MQTQLRPPSDLEQSETNSRGRDNADARASSGTSAAQNAALEQAAARLRQKRLCRCTHSHRAREIDVEHLRERCRIELVVPADDAGCIDQHVQIGDSAQECADRSLARYIEVRRENTRMGGLGSRQPCGDHSGSGRRESRCDRAPYAAGAACHQNGLPHKIKHGQTSRPTAWSSASPLMDMSCQSSAAAAPNVS